ncbi:MAG: DUF4012 domain-containing protein, partial [Acidimicrobiales bacterium]|nr:DUF4012 domain-containing protein [Acidimicrobiales bacterium]
MRRLSGQRRSFDIRRRARRLRRRLGLPRGRRAQIGILLAAVAGVIAVWGVVDVVAARRDLLMARNDLAAAASNLGTATDADATNDLRTATRDAVSRTDRARRRLNRAPLLRAADLVPIVRNQRRDLLRAVNVANDAAIAGDALAARVEGVRSGLAVRNASVDLTAVSALADAAAEAGTALQALPRTHRGGQWGPLARATTDLDDVVSDTAQRLVTGADIMRVASRLLGVDKPSRIFVALLNNAEMRDQGMVLSYAVAQTQAGSLQVTRFGSITDLELRAPVRDITLPAGTKAMFGQLQPLQYWQSVNATADTALSGASMASMYRAATGDTIDGVIALDVPALAALLSVTGPVSVSGIAVPVSAENAATVLLNDLYANQLNNTTDREARQQKLASVTAAVIERIRTASLTTSAIVRALGDAAAGGHAWVTSTRPEDQLALERSGLSGRPGRVGGERTIHFSVQNGTATKLDWFVDPEVDVDVYLTPDGTALVTTKVSVPNTAPVPTPSTEQFGPDNIVNS